ncbi:MAG TPA: DUF2269 family protein [Candidatus Saccharimonadia bacterium]|nr:DUF2269 family protein [Candidatus Saccharimonadia bacterium]
MEWLMKVLLILAVVGLLGNLLMAPFWRKRMADLGGAQTRAAANRSVRVADLMFTLPGWVVVLATGIMLIIYRGMHGGWLHLSLVLFLGWLVLWHVLVLRARKDMIAQAEEVAAGGQMPTERTTRLGENERQWQKWSYLSAAVAVIILILMVTRPF